MTNTKKLLAMLLAMLMIFSSVGMVACAYTLAKADGNAYFYFSAGGINADVCKSGFSVNGNAVNYITSLIAARTERLDTAQLIQNAVNTITVYTGNADGIVDETKSWKEGGKACDEFGITSSTIRLILPDGTIVSPSKKIVYKPADETTPLKDSYIATEYTGTGGINLGDNNLTDYNYKVELQFDLTGKTWENTTAVIPAIKNVSLQIGRVPSERNVVWYSTSQNTGTIQLALKSAMTGDTFPTASMTTFTATAEETGWTGYKSYKATMTGLAENQEYIYRVGNDTDGYSNIYSFKTQEFDGSFSFLAVSDPQLGQGNRFSNIQDEINGWTTTLNKAKASYFGDAAFIASMGDQIAKTEIDIQHDAFFAPEALKAFSLAVVPGNHDVGGNYTSHYNMPNVSSLGVSATMGSGSGDYYFTYGDALFMIINQMNTNHDEHIKFLEETVEAHPDSKWKFVMMHYAIYGSTTQGDETPQIKAHKEALAPVFSRLGIDVVFQGHEHCYARSYMMNGATPNTATGENGVTQPNPNEVLYLTFNSASGSDYITTVSENLAHLAKRDQQSRPNFSKIDITDATFTVTSYYSDSEAVVSAADLVDTYTITRDTTTPTVKSVHIADEAVTIEKGKSLALTAQAYGYNTPSQKMTWRVSGNQSTNTKISEEGVLTVDVDEAADSLVVTACAADDADKYDTINVTLASAVTSVNVAPKGNYTLPATVGEVEVTGWTNAQGNAVTEADTSVTGYRYYTAALADGTTEKYRVNVGEYVRKYDDLLAGFSVGCVNDNDTTGTNEVYTAGNGQLVVAKNDAPKIDVVNYDENTKALKLGPTGTINSSHIALTPAYKGEYRFNTRVKIEGITSSRTGDFLVGRWDIFASSASKLINRVFVYATKDNYLKFNVGSTYRTSTVPIDDNGNTPWFDVSYCVYNDSTCSLSVNGVELFNKQTFTTSGASVGFYGFSPVNWDSKDEYTHVTYCTDVTLDTVRYFTGNLPTDTTAEITQGAAGVQSTTATLTMSDGKTQSFDVTFTADTTKTGIQTVKGTIDGFDDKIPVAVAVKNIITGVSADGAAIEKATIQKVGNIASGVAVFAYYGSDHKIAAVKSVPFAESDFTNGVAELNVGLVLPDVEGGYIKGFVFKNLTGIIPLDTVFTPAS